MHLLLVKKLSLLDRWSCDGLHLNEKNEPSRIQPSSQAGNWVMILQETNLQVCLMNDWHFAITHDAFEKPTPGSAKSIV